MKATILYRVASLLLIVTVAANTAWLVFFWHAGGPTNSAHFPFGHRPLTYVQIILALEVFCSLCVLFGAFLSWHLGALARTAPEFVGNLGWRLVAYQTVGTFVTLFYFSGFAFLLPPLLQSAPLGLPRWLTADRQNRLRHTSPDDVSANFGAIASEAPQLGGNPAFCQFLALLPVWRQLGNYRRQTSEYEMAD